MDNVSQISPCPLHSAVITGTLLTAQSKKHPETLMFFRVLNKNCQLADALCNHCIYNLFKTCNIGAGNIVALFAVTLCSLVNIMVNIYHDILQLGVNLLKCSAQPL